MLNERQHEEFWEKGFVVARRAVAASQLARLTRELEGWIEESRSHAVGWGRQPNGATRFDLEGGHSARSPMLRRVNNPADISDTYKEFVFDGPIPDLVATLIGPNVKFHHCKLNIKLPGMEMRFDYHQDHVFSPQTNDDMVASLLLLDRMDEENGCLKVVPGSHRQRFSHYQGDRFTGSIAPDLFDELDRAAETVVGHPGDVCLMHTWAAHRSGSNRSTEPRRIFVADYTAADAFPVVENSAPSVHLGHVVRGNASRVARIVAGTIELPQVYKEDTYFERLGQPTSYEG